MLRIRKQLFVIAVVAVVACGISTSHAAVIVLDSQTINNGGSGVALPFTGLSGYNASAASKLVVTIGDEDGFGDSLPTGVSFAGEDFQLAVTHANSIQHTWIYYLDATAVGGTFGTGDLVIEGSGSDDFAGALLALSNTVDGVATSNFSQTQSVTIDTTIDGSIVVASTANNNSGATAQLPLTSILNSDAGSAGTGAGYAITDPAVTGGTYSFTGGSSRPVTVAAVFTPVPEPASLILLGLGSVTILGRRRQH